MLAVPRPLSDGLKKGQANVRYRPIADVVTSCYALLMSTERFIAGQRRGVNVILTAFAIVVSFMWAATLCDWTFNLGWGWDVEILWLAPLILLFAVVLRSLYMAIFRFVGDDLNVRLPPTTDIRRADARAAQLEVRAFCKRKRVLYIDAEIAHRAVELGVAKQYLNGTYIPGLAIDQGDLGPAKRVCSVAGRLNADLMKPSFEQARIVARGEADTVVPSGGEQEITVPGPPLAYPGEDAVARSLRHLEANRRSRLLLNDQRSACLRASTPRAAPGLGCVSRQLSRADNAAGSSLSRVTGPRRPSSYQLGHPRVPTSLHKAPRRLSAFRAVDWIAERPTLARSRLAGPRPDRPKSGRSALGTGFPLPVVCSATTRSSPRSQTARQFLWHR